MKKLSTLFLALCAVMTMNAELIWHESFDRPLGNVANGGISANKDQFHPDASDVMGTDTENWWVYSQSKSDSTSVWAGSLSFPGYAANPAGGKVQSHYGPKVDVTNPAVTGESYGQKVLRQFAPVNSGKLYFAALINVDSLSAATTVNTLISFGDATASYTYGKLWVARTSTTSDTYKLAVGKGNETHYNTSDYNQLPETDQAKVFSPELQIKTTHLVVVEYEFVDGVKNDICRLYVDPTAGTTEYTAMTIASYAKNGVTMYGANFQTDATAIKSFNINCASTFRSVYIDEIKVATSWDDLFEAGDGALIKANKSEVVKYIPAGGSFADSVVVTVENASAGDLLTAQSQDPNSIILVDDEAFDGIDASNARLTTGLTIHFWSDSTATISESGSDVLEIACGSATKEIAVNWVVLPTISSLADVNDSVIYTGNAQVTYKANGIITLQDDNGAIAVNALAGFEVGDVVTNLVLLDSVVSYARESHSKVVYTVAAAEHSDMVYEATPLVVSIADLDLAQHMHMLVKLDTVSLKDTYGDVGTFSSLTYGRNIASKGGSSIYVVTPAGNSLVGQAMYATANVVGVINAFPENTIIPDAAIVTTINPRGVEDVEEVIKRTLSFSSKSVNIEGTMYVDSVYTSTMLLRGSNLIGEVSLTAENVELGSYEFTADSVNRGATVTITIAPLSADPEWTGSIVATCGDLTATVTMSGVVAVNEPIGPTGVNNVATEVKTVKVIKNGQVRIVRGENEFSVLGEQVK